MVRRSNWRVVWFPDRNCPALRRTVPVIQISCCDGSVCKGGSAAIKVAIEPAARTADACTACARFFMMPLQSSLILLTQGLAAVLRQLPHRFGAKRRAVTGLAAQPPASRRACAHTHRSADRLPPDSQLLPQCLPDLPPNRVLPRSRLQVEAHTPRRLPSLCQ